MEFNFNKMSYSLPLIKRLSSEKDIKTINDVIDSLSQKENIEFEEGRYYFIMSILSQNLKNIFEEDIFESLFMDAATWASSKETKQKIRPKTFKDIKSKKSQRYFTKISKAIVLTLIQEHLIEGTGLEKQIVKDYSLNYIKFQDELASYTNLLYEVSCIRRIRSSKES